MALLRGAAPDPVLTPRAGLVRRVDLKKKPGFTNIAKVYPEPTFSWLLSWCVRADKHSPRRQPLTCSARAARQAEPAQLVHQLAQLRLVPGGPRRLHHLPVRPGEGQDLERGLGHLPLRRQHVHHADLLRLLVAHPLLAGLRQAQVQPGARGGSQPNVPQRLVLRARRGAARALGGALHELLRDREAGLHQGRGAVLVAGEHRAHGGLHAGHPALPLRPLLLRAPLHPHPRPVQVRALAPPPQHRHRALRRALHAPGKCSALCVFFRVSSKNLPRRSSTFTTTPASGPRSSSRCRPSTRCGI